MKSNAESTTHSRPVQAETESVHQKEQERELFIPPKVQAKLKVNQPGDAFEQQADAVAAKVSKSPPEPAAAKNVAAANGTATLKSQPTTTPNEESDGIQRKKEEEPALAIQEEIPVPVSETVQKAEATQATPEEGMLQKSEAVAAAPQEDTVQKSEEEKVAPEVEMVQRAPAKGNGEQAAPELVNDVVNSGGTTLDTDVRGDMEGQLGGDFSQVKVHDDEKANKSADAISAQAYTYGNHVVFAKGKYAPKTPAGRELMSHELVHVQQQSGQVQRRLATDGQAAPTDAASTPIAAEPASAPPPAATPTTAGPDNTADAIPPPPPPAAEIDLLVPPAPDTLRPAARARLNKSRDKAATATEMNADLPSAAERTEDARGGVTEPQEESDARAGAEVTATLQERLAPSPEIEELCQRIRKVIRDKRPPDEDSLLSADPEEAANEAGTQLNEDIDQDLENVESEYDDLDQNPTGTTEQIGAEVPQPPSDVNEPGLNAPGAAPDPLTEEEVSLDADLEAASADIEAAGMNTEPAQLVETGPIADTRAAEGELTEAAAEDPALVLAEQDQALTDARADLAALQENALAVLAESRASTVSDTGNRQTDMVGSEEEQRRVLGERAEGLFIAAQEQVNTILEPLSATAMDMWEAGKSRIATEFEQHLARVQSWLDERYSGTGGGITEWWDDVTGMPDWVTEEYNDAEETFGDDICDLIREVSLHVNSVIVTCEKIIDKANLEINNLFENAPPELAEWAAGQQEAFQGRLDGLRDEVKSTQQNFNRDLVERASTAVQEVRQKVHALREKAKGILGRLADKLAEFLEDPARAIINGLLSLVGIDPSAFWALIAKIGEVMTDIADDPMNFANNLMAGIGAGFEAFFDNFGTHFFDALVTWLFSGLGQLGIEIPTELTLKSIVTFFLQLMGITWDRIKELLANHIGEENVALLEQAYELVSELITLGPEGVFQLLEDKLDPSNILDTIIQMAVDFVIETLVTQATIRILGLFNPVGAIYQAIEAIYKVLKWVFENAARIFTLIETVVNGIAEIIAGNISSVATLVENALAQLMVPVIDFVAEFMSLGDLPDKVADAVRGLQSWVEGILDKVIGFLADQAKAILRSLGIGEDEEPADEEEEGEELEDEEVGETVHFSADGESHRIWIDTEGSGVKVMMASRAAEMEVQIRELEEKAAEKNIDGADALIAEVRAKLAAVDQQATTTENLIEEATDEENTTEEVEAAETADELTERLEKELADAMKEAIEAINPPMPESPDYDHDSSSTSKSDHVSVSKITDANKRDGSEPGDDTLTEAWEIITNLGVNENSWVRFHVLNKLLGGMGVNYNLLPAIRSDNRKFESRFESKLKTLSKNVPVWFLGATTYYPNHEHFSNSFEAIGGGMKYKDGEWVEDPDNSIPTYKLVPGQPEVGKLNLNELLSENDPDNAKFFERWTPITGNMYKELKKNKPTEGYKDLAQVIKIAESIYTKPNQAVFLNRLKGALTNFSKNLEF